ncbi:Vacuolar protein sorting-associated protein 37A [Mortierella claussenii]|nr:Vacuolar protein sorting-associated protein 37A [Mortierella claussenii]
MSTHSRRKQIESLFMELPQLRVAPNDDSRFQLTLQLAFTSESTLSSSSNSTIQATAATAGAGATSTATLTIILPPSFPEEEPKITIQPTVRHLWVDGTVTPCAVTGHDRLLPGAWSAHANLGRIVKEIVTNIQRTGVLVGGENNESNGTSGTLPHSNNPSGSKSGVYEEYSYKPPPPIPGARTKTFGQVNNHSLSMFSNTNGSPYHHSVSGGVGSSSNMMSSSSSSADAVTGHHIQMHPNSSGAYSSTLSPEARIVMELTTEQIEEYLESPIAFEHFFDRIDVVANSRTLKREWWHGNDNVARRNLCLEAELKELQNSTAEGHRVAMQLQKTLEEKLQQQQDALWRFKPETLQSKLRSAAAESDELSESVAQSFLEGKLAEADFIRQFRDLRKVYHMREMKNERIETILRNNTSAGGGNNSGGNSGSSSMGGGGKGGGSELSGFSTGSILKSSGGGGSVAGGTSGKSNGDPWVML